MPHRLHLDPLHLHHAAPASLLANRRCIVPQTRYAQQKATCRPSSRAHSAHQPKKRKKSTPAKRHRFRPHTICLRPFKLQHLQQCNHTSSLLPPCNIQTAPRPAR